MGFNVISKNYFNKLDACRLIVNSFKHGDGGSFTDLKNKYPQYINTAMLGRVVGNYHCDYEYIQVTDAQIDDLSNAIIAFWNDMPEKVSLAKCVNIPQWFQRAFAADNTPRKKVFL